MIKKHARGFTLVELALVIVLISIFMGLGLGVLATLQTKNAFDETRRKQEKTTSALVTYFSNNQRLPCPDTNPVAGAASTGKENRTNLADPNTPCSDPAGTVIAPAIGVLPFAALGLSRDDALDGWDNFFTYQVSLETGVRPENEDWSVTPVTGSITANLGSIQLNTRDGAGVPVTLNNPGAGQGNLAVIISHGPNGLGAYTTKGTRNVLPPPGTDELDNTDGDSLFYQRQYTEVAGPGGTFDDLVRDFTAIDILAPVIRDGALQSATAQVREQLKTIRDTAFGQVPVDVPPSCFPPLNLAALALPATITVDPWGTTINYFGATAQLTAATPAGTTHAFCFWSFGPNGVNNSVPLPPPNCPAIAGDDVGLAPVTYGQLRTAYPAAVCP